MKTLLENRIAYYQQKIDRLKSQLVDDYAFYLSWNAEDLYKHSVRIMHYKSWLNCEDYTDTIRLMQDYLNGSYNVTGSSTNAMANLCTQWKYQVTLELLKELQTWSNQ